MIWCIIFIVLGIAMMTAGEMLIMNAVRTTDEDNAVIGTLVLGLSIMSFCLSTEFLTFHLNEPTPLDVYRGNTTLEIHSIDGVPTDSIVVFKKK